MPERLASGRVGQVQLYHGSVKCLERVMERPRGVSEGTRVDDDGASSMASGMDGLDEVSLMVRLEVVEGEAERGRSVQIGRASCRERV